jgi:RimJ/RimL family protein N-acetyltransferase
MHKFEAERLLLRPFTWDDFAFINALHADPDVARYIGYGKPRTETENRRLPESTLKAYSREGLGHLAVCLKDTGEYGLTATLTPLKTARLFFV